MFKLFSCNLDDFPTPSPVVGPFAVATFPKPDSYEVKFIYYLGIPPYNNGPAVPAPPFKLLGPFLE